MARQLKRNSPSLARLRGKPLNLEEYVAEFGGGDADLAARYAIAIDAFFGGSDGKPDEWGSYLGRLSPNTRRSYSFAIQQFFEWTARQHGKVLPPHLVRRRDAEEFVNWLANRPFGLEEEKLADGDVPERLIIYKTVESLGAANLKQIVESLPASFTHTPVLEDGGRIARGKLEFEVWVSKQLGRMVLHDELSREPTMQKLREIDPRFGISAWMVRIDGKTGERTAIGQSRNEFEQATLRIDPTDPLPTIIHLRDLFIYRIRPQRRLARSSILVRLSALSSFWDTLAQGENVPGGQSVLTHNIWRPLIKRASRGMSKERRLSAHSQKIEGRLVVRMLACSDKAERLVDLRNKALIYFMVFTGVRIDEALQIRRGNTGDNYRGWFDGTTDPPSVVVTRKGGVRTRIPYPPIALRALAEFQLKLLQEAVPPTAQWEDPKSKGWAPLKSPRWRYRALQKDEAPLFPPLSFWGANSDKNYTRFKPNSDSGEPPNWLAIPYTKSMSEAGAWAALREIARACSFSPSELRQVHPHAFRHFALSAMLKGGKDVREVQAIAGHESLTTTERYLDQIAEVPMSGQNEVLSHLQSIQAGDVIEQSPVQPPRGVVVDTVAVPIEEQPLPEQPELQVIPPMRPTDVEITFLEAPEVLPENVYPVAPEVDAPAPGEALPPGAGLVGIAGQEKAGDDENITDVLKENESPGSPEWVYRALRDAADDRAAGARESELDTDRERIQFTYLTPRVRKDKVTPGKTISIKTRKVGERLEKVEIVQQNPWLREHYDPWPQNYGVGQFSLLPWYARGSANRAGEVKVAIDAKGTTVLVPPVPVLSPAQATPETPLNESLLNRVERLYDLWLLGDPERGISPSPTRTFGLVKWWGLLCYNTATLERFYVERKDRMPEWQPWNATCKLGADLRTHDDEWIERWLETNAHTYQTTVGVFREELSRDPDKVPTFEAFEETSFRAASQVERLPEWMADEDPIRSLHDKDPDEWRRFAQWMESVTGKRMSQGRKNEREEQKKTSKESWEIERDAARGFLDLYFDVQGEIESAELGGNKYAAGDEGESLSVEDLSFEEIRALKAQRSELAKHLRDKLGIDPRDPSTASIKDRKKRITALLDKRFPQGAASELLPPNMLESSILFDSRWFEIDSSSKTLRLGNDFPLSEFQDRFGRQDPLLILRRAARGMWDYARQRGGDGKHDPSERSMIRSILLSYLSWVVPAPKEMEEQLARAGYKAIESHDRKAWLREYQRSIRAMLGLEEEESDVPGVMSVAEQVLREFASVAVAEQSILAEGLTTAGKTRKKKETEPAQPVRKLSPEETRKRSRAAKKGAVEKIEEAVPPVSVMPIRRRPPPLSTKAAPPAEPPAPSAPAPRRRQIVIDVEKKMTPNGTVFHHREEPSTPGPDWYRVNLAEEGELSANPRRGSIFISPKAVAESLRVFYASARMVASPFRVIGAMLTR